MKSSLFPERARMAGAGRMPVFLLTSCLVAPGLTRIDCSDLQAAGSPPNTPTASHHAERPAIHALAFSHDGRQLAIGSQDQYLRIWDLESLKLKQALPTETSLRSVAFSPDGKTLAGGGMDRVARLWVVAGGRFSPGHSLHCQGPVEALAFSPDGKTIACGTFGAGNVHLYDPKTGRLKRTFWEASNGINSVGFLRDGKTLASGGANLKLWDARVDDNARQELELPIAELEASQKKWLRVELGDYGATLVACSPTKDLVVSADGTGGVTAPRKALRIWDTRTHGLIGQMRVEGPGELTSLDVSPDGRLVAAGGDTGDLWVWEVESGKRSWSTNAHARAIRAVAFSPAEPVLASAGDDGIVRLWDVTAGRLVKVLGSDER